MLRFTPLLAAATFAALAGSAPAASTITGKLSKKGYTVVALAKDGTAASAKAKSGAFAVKAPAGTVTVQLRAPNGRYAGPIVVGKKHGKVVLGIRRGARLGKVVVKSGYATPAKKVPSRFVNPKVVATAKGGGPIGSKTFGLVPGGHLRQTGPAPNPGGPAPNSGGPTPPGGSEGTPGPTSGGTDTDSDGVPNALDVDANGNGVLDNVDPEAPPAGGFGVFSQMFLSIDQTVNADASAITKADVDATMKDHMFLVFTGVPDNTELDCGGLSYCSAGGTGEKQTGPVEVGGSLDPFPACCDSDGNGFGTISGGATNGPSGAEFMLKPNAGSADIGSGDTLIERVTTATGTQEIPGALNFVFSTIPALQQWSSGTSTTPTVVSYPVAAGGPGTQGNPLPITKADNGDYTLTMSFWRPQRKAIAGAGEGTGTVDIGGLSYDVNIPNINSAPGSSGPGSSPQCPPGALRTTDPNLSVASQSADGSIGRLLDKAPDAPSDPANTITFSVDLSKCFSLKGATLDAGRTLNMDVGANSVSSRSVDHANQIVYVKTQ